ncbi:MAG: hypothetical protein ACLQGJ_07025 [Candidatus Dormibacteria bacterium]
MGETVNGDRIARPDLNARRSHWREAEARLYPVVMVRPDLYERSLVAVRETVERLQRVETIDDLVSIEPQIHDLVVDALAELGASTAELNLELIAGTALSMRCGQIDAVSARSRRAGLIAEARSEGDAWVALAEAGERRAGGRPLPPYRRLEMRVADGLGLHLYVEYDPSTTLPVYGLELVQLDPQTGDWLGDATPPTTAVFDSPEPWDAEAHRLREGSPPAGGGAAPLVP